MTPTEYQKLSLETESKDFDAIRERLKDTQLIRLLHAGMGLATEAAEFLDMLKKHIYYGKPLDIVNLREELGDSMWYTALGSDACVTDLCEIMETNVKKLQDIRYKNKFNEQDALNRDLNAERKVLEK
jgi:NTP pyrophosphatase (non-canonical NTP hydrolase)